MPRDSISAYLNLNTKLEELVNDKNCNLKQAQNVLYAGLGFSRPKPVFPVQNGINWDKPVFPSFSRPKLGKTVQNWEKLCCTIFQASKSSPKCDVSNKSLTGQTRGSYNPVVMMYELIIQMLWIEISVILIIQLVLTFTHNTIILLPSHVQNCDLICKYQ